MTSLELVRFDYDKDDCKPHLVGMGIQGKRCSLGKSWVSSLVCAMMEVLRS